MRDIDKKLFKKLSILYVEDDDFTREEISFFLKKICGNVTNATNGAEGLQAFQTEKFDMVITDIQMPVMNGLDMVKEIRKIDSRVPIAVTTAFSDSDFLVKSIECGVDKYILKPIDMMEMLTVIQKCTEPKTLLYKLESYDAYSRFLLQNNAKFMLIIHQGDFDYASKELLQLFAVDSFEALRRQSLEFCEEDKCFSEKEWINFVQKHPEKSFFVTLSGKRFLLEHRHFQEIDKSVFLFHGSTEESIETFCQTAEVA
jgi:YesN/AraC family two-component response regulator